MDSRPFSRLPFEVISEVVDYLPAAQLLTLTSTSRTFNALCTRRIYKNVVLDGMEQTKRCCETLSFNDDAAQHVRTLRLKLPKPAKTEGTTSQFDRVLRAALKNIAPTLTSLDLSGCGLELVPFLKRLSFSRLLTFNTMSPLGPDLVQFLLAHPQLESLYLFGGINLPQKNRAVRGCHREMLVSMPSLSYFMGPSEAVPFFLPGSKINEVDITLGSRGRQTDRVEQKLVDALFATSKPITSLGFIEFNYHRILFDLIGEKLVHLTRLNFVCLPYASDREQILSGLAAVLPNLPSLYHIQLLPFGKADPADIDLEVLDLDSILISTWSELRPTLAMCQMPCGVWWGRLLKSDQWVPLIMNPAGLQWMFKQTSLLDHIQRRVFAVMIQSGLDRGDDPIPPPDVEDDVSSTAMHRISLSLGHLMNRAFGLPADPQETERDGDDADARDAEDEDEEQRGSRERLRIPIHDDAGGEILPYASLNLGERAEDVWATVLALLGFTLMYPLSELVSTELLHNILGGVEPPVPVLSERGKELLSFVLDLFWNSLNGDGIEIRRYLRDPGDFWRDQRIGLHLRRVIAVGLENGAMHTPFFP